MKPQNELALIVAYFLSRLDKDAPALLGYSNFNHAAREIGRILDVKPSTVKNMRDEFDYHLENSRVGWKRELRGSRLKVLQTFQTVGDDELLQVAKEIIENKDWSQTEGYRDLHVLLAESEKTPAKTKDFIIRGPTGRAAEEYYMNYFVEHPLPAKGELIDCRDMGCGYDFRIEAAGGEVFYIEVKGLATGDGGILITDKEWQTAIKHRRDYYLVIIKNISSEPILNIIQDPGSKLNPMRNVYTTVQVNWAVPAKALVERS